MKLKRWYPELIGLIAATAATRLWTLFAPNAVVFDEVYFKAFAAHYLDGKYYFDIHPPLAKLLLSGLAQLQGLTADTIINGTALSLRLLPAVAGVLLVPLMWGILRRLGATRIFAFIGASLVLLDNAILVESRFILMDSLLFLFGLGALYFYLIARDAKNNLRWPWLTLAAASAGAAMSIKWTGIAALGIIGLVWVWDQRNTHILRRQRLLEFVILAVIPFLIYVGAFWLHFKLLNHSGEGDAFMTPRFQSTLIGNPSYDPTAHLTFFEKFQELNVQMFKSNQTLTASHPYSSPWYTWPSMERPIYYWQGEKGLGDRQGNIYLLGNPAIWWGLWLAVLAGLAYTWLKGRSLRPQTITALAIAGLSYVINFLPFVAVPRVMFLYHYFFSFFFSIIFTVMLWNDLATPQKGQQLADPKHRVALAIVLVLILMSFIFFAPLTYGTPLSAEELQTRMWLPSWR